MILGIKQGVNQNQASYVFFRLEVSFIWNAGFLTRILHVVWNLEDFTPQSHSWHEVTFQHWWRPLPFDITFTKMTFTNRWNCKGECYSLYLERNWSYAIGMCPHLVGLYVECFMSVNVWLQHLKYNVENVRQIVEIPVDSCNDWHVQKLEFFFSRIIRTIL